MYRKLETPYYYDHIITGCAFRSKNQHKPLIGLYLDVFNNPVIYEGDQIPLNDFYGKGGYKNERNDKGAVNRYDLPNPRLISINRFNNRYIHLFILGNDITHHGITEQDPFAYDFLSLIHETWDPYSTNACLFEKHIAQKVIGKKFTAKWAQWLDPKNKTIFFGPDGEYMLPLTENDGKLKRIHQKYI